MLVKPWMQKHIFSRDDCILFRNIPEPRIVDFLCSPYELREGRQGRETEAMARLLQRLIDTGLPFRPGVGQTRLFDPAEVVNFIKYAFHALGDPTWLERSVGVMRRLVAEEADAVGRIEVTITRCFSAGAVPPGALARLHMPKPLNAEPGSHEVQWMRMDGVVGDPVDEGGRYVVRVRGSSSTSVEISLRHRFVPSGYLGEAGGALTLRPREGLIKITPRILALAEALGLPTADRWEGVRRIWDFLFDELSFGFIHYSRLSKDDPLAWCLDRQRVDCRTGSALIVALCRAAAIPARMVAGYTLNPVLPTSHVWAEVWFDDVGWRPFDTYAVDLAGDERASAWRDHYFGRLDRRFVAEVYPREFCGLGSPRLPACWQLSMAATKAGAATWFHDVSDGAAFHRETVAVEAL